MKFTFKRSAAPTVQPRNPVPTPVASTPRVSTRTQAARKTAPPTQTRRGGLPTTAEAEYDEDGEALPSIPGLSFVGARQQYELERDALDETKQRNMRINRQLARARRTENKRGAPRSTETTVPVTLTSRDNKERLTIDNTTPSIYGCCGLFDLCNDKDLMSLTFQGADPFMDWLGWTASDVCLIQRSFISYVRPEMDGGSGTPGYVSDPCADPNSVEWGVRVKGSPVAVAQRPP